MHGSFCLWHSIPTNVSVLDWHRSNYAIREAYVVLVATILIFVLVLIWRCAGRHSLNTRNFGKPATILVICSALALLTGKDRYVSFDPDNLNKVLQFQTAVASYPRGKKLGRAGDDCTASEWPATLLTVLLSGTCGFLWEIAVSYWITSHCPEPGEHGLHADQRPSAPRYA